MRPHRSFAESMRRVAMKRTFASAAACVMLLGSGLALRASADDASKPPDLSGPWRLDPAHSDTFHPPGRSGGEGGGGHGGGAEGGGWGGHHGGGGGGGWSGGGGGYGGHHGGGGSGGEESGGGAGGGAGGAPSGGERPRPVLLPDFFHITQTDSDVSFEDSTGTVMQEIATVSADHDTLLHAPSAQVVYGQWKGSKLEIQRQGPRGGQVTQTFELGSHGETLVIEIKMAANGPMPGMTVKRVYTRVKQS
jgi:hypothetical protein